ARPRSTVSSRAGRPGSVPATSAASSSGRRLRRRAGVGRARVLLLALCLTGCSAGPALDVKVWPILRYSRNDTRGELHWSALGPLIEYVRTPKLRDLRIRPLLWLSRRLGDVSEDRMELLFPLLTASRQAGYQTVRLLLLSRTWTAPRDPAAAATSSFTLFPLVFWRRDPQHGPHGGVLPFYLDLADVFGYEQVRTVLFPAYLELDEPQVVRRFYAFPFVSTV